MLIPYVTNLTLFTQKVFSLNRSLAGNIVGVGICYHSLDSMRYARSWPAWVEENCTALAEHREVPCISLETVLGEWLQGRPMARLKIDAQGSDLDVVKSAGLHVDKILFVVLEAQGTFEAALYEGQKMCDEIQTEMRSLGFILADSGSLPGCNRTGGLPYPFHEEDIAFVRHELRHLWRSFYTEHPYCRKGILSAAGACGGPYCMAPEIGLHVNRSGGCDGLIQDTLTFTSRAVGLALLGTSGDCWSHVRVEVQRGNLTVQVLQGRTRGHRRCPARFVATQSLHGPLMRVRVGSETSADFRVRLLLLPGLLDMPPPTFQTVFEDFRDVISRSVVASGVHFVWPRGCASLPGHVQSYLSREYHSTLLGPSSTDICIMEKKRKQRCGRQFC